MFNPFLLTYVLSVTEFVSSTMEKKAVKKTADTAQICIFVFFGGGVSPAL